MTTHYTRSNGEQVAIATMPHFKLRPALAKLVRERADDSRDAEIAAMTERLALLDAEHEAEAATMPGAA